MPVIQHYVGNYALQVTIYKSSTFEEANIFLLDAKQKMYILLARFIVEISVDQYKEISGIGML